jgi:selenide,water dikinase
MGGKPIMAIAILGWPIDKLPLETAKRVIEGARAVCDDAGIALSGGHSIEIGDPVFGLAVTGIVDTKNVKENSGAKKGDRIFLTKPLGIGIMATAEKQGKIEEKHRKEIVRWMTTLNKVGQELSKFTAVNTITDVTGFGLVGHLIEICEASKLAAKINFDKVPLIEGLEKYIELKTFPGGLFKNYKSYKHQLPELTDMQKYVLCDAQTSGGLLVAVDANNTKEVVRYMKENNQHFYEIGEIIEQDKSGELISFF